MSHIGRQIERRIRRQINTDRETHIQFEKHTDKQTLQTRTEIEGIAYTED